MDIDAHIECFKRYVKSFYGNDEFVNRNMLLKQEHTFRVLDITKRIARDEHVDGKIEELSLMGALYHDIGRFEQFKQYKTFVDARSINHAHLGSEILKSNNFLRDITGENAEAVIAAVECHNMKEIPFVTPESTRTILQIIRDADKIDIMQILCEYYNERKKTKNHALELDLPDTPGYTYEIYRDVYEGKAINNSRRNNYNDMKLGHLAWVYDLNFKSSIMIYRENNYIGKIVKHLPANGEIEKLHGKLNYYIDYKLGLVS